MIKERTPYPHRLRDSNILAAVITLFLASTLLTACTADAPHDGTPAVTRLPIAFSASAGTGSAAGMSVSSGPDSRASGDIDDTEALKVGTGFGVFASYTGSWRYTTTTVSPDFLCNQQVEWSAVSPQAWQYSPLKYWPNGEGDATPDGTSEIEHHVSFFAYAPWSDLVTTSSVAHAPANCITDCSQTYEQGDPWVLYRIAGSAGSDPTSLQVDLLYAACDYYHYGLGDGLCNIDLSKPEVSGSVAFTFRHALGTVGDKVAVSASPALQSVLNAAVTGSVTAVSLKLKSITIEYTLTSKARLVLYARDGQPNWHNVTSENVKTTRTVRLSSLDHTLYSYDGTTAEAISYDGWSGKGVFYIPIEGDDYVQRARITIGYQVLLTGGTPYPSTGSATITKNVVLHEQEAYGAGKRLDFDITLGESIPISE